MKVLLVLLALTAFVAAAVLTPKEIELLQAFDYGTLLANDEVRNIVFDCLLEKGECGAYSQMAELSVKLVIHQCAECSPAQKTRYTTIMKMVHDKYEPFYNEFMKKVAAKKE